ncbi:phage major capsid protein [Tetragenococcus halophilus]|uniref:Capsid protein n=1 Tax=Tetragenococcus halophilus (strain DSM 20338 / JCM 20259 / NCIMB 9735 / NBRC 12172) TaxID=945021 RepID=A0AAN1VRJ0_TETHN|nr:phage major capsid protein [Tetragenococcus halophilus]BAK95135.1 putative capsid protein [Tetragenococcus halophilus NBRC 12172]GBD71121.1 putative capsid protein [Tetragenococcus halophilus subsp. halophilus]
MNNFDERKKEIDDLIAQAKKAIEDGDLEKARNIKADIDAKKQEFEELKQLSAEIEESSPEGSETETEEPESSEEEPESSETEEPPSEEEQETPTEEVEEPTEEELEEDEEKKKKEEAKRSMAKIDKNQETNEEILGFEQYMKTKGAKRDNVKSDDVGVTIPEDIQYTPEKEVNTVQDLSQLVQKTSVNTKSGKHPILKRAEDEFHTVEELQANPELANPKFEEIGWEVQTYRGAIPISQEALDDSVANLTNIVRENIREQKVNTLNSKIGALLKQFNPTTVSDVDDLKAITNVDLDPAYERRIVCTQSFYQKLDTLKDENGRYLLQDSIINTSGNTVLGMPISVVRDNLLGQNGDALAYIGDVRRAVFFADRSDVSVQWVENSIYGKYLMGAFRFDVKQADENAGYFVTFEDEGEATPS